MKKYSAIRFIFLGVILILFITFKVLKNESVTLKYVKKNIDNTAAERNIAGIYPINIKWKENIITKKGDDAIELQYFDNDSLKNHHYKKTITVRPGYIFWNPFIYEETDIFTLKKDSITNITLTTVYSHQYTHGEDPWGLSFLEIRKYGSLEKSKQVNKQKIDSVLKSWK